MADAPKGLLELQALDNLGYGPDDLALHEENRRFQLQILGYSQEDADQFFGGRPPISVDEEGLRQHFESVFSQADFTKAETLWDAYVSGIQGSVSGLAGREAMPELILPEDAPIMHKLAAMAGTFTGDVPTITAGFVAGGGMVSPVTGAAGAFAFTEGTRRVLMEKYANGSATSLNDFLSRIFFPTMIDAGKGYVLGAALGATGKIASSGARALGTPAAPVVLATEIPVLTKVGSAMEGHVPEPEDFLLNAVLIGGLRHVSSVTRAMRKTYAKTGRHPAKVVEDAKVNPTITEDLLARNQETPRAYRSIAEGETRSQGAATRKPTLRLEEAEAVTDRVAARIDQLRGRPVKPAEITEAQVTAEAQISRSIEAAEGQLGRLAESIEAARPKPVDVPRSLDAASLKLRARVEADARKLAATLDDVGRGLNQRQAVAPVLLERAAALMERTTLTVRPHLITREATEVERKISIPSRPAHQKQILDQLSIGEEVRHPHNLWGDIQRHWFDRLHPLKEAVTAMSEGRELKAVEDAYLLARLEVASASKGTHFIEFGTRDFNNFLPNGKGLREILDPGYNPNAGFRGRTRNMLRTSRKAYDLDDLRVFLSSKRVLELEQRGVSSGFDRQAAAKSVVDLEGKLGRVGQEIVDFQARVLDYAKKAGLLSEESAELILHANRTYVPFHRMLEAPERGGKGKALQGTQPFKRIAGVDKKVKTIDPVESIIRNTFVQIAQAEKNAVARAFVDLAESSPRGAEFATRITKKVKPIRLTDAERDRLLRRIDGDDLGDITPEQLGRIDDILENQFAIFRAEAFRGEKGTLNVWRNGVREQWKVDNELWEVFKGQDAQTSNLLAKAMKAPARTLRAGAVLSPEFIGRNFQRDNLTAFLFSENGFVPFVDFTRGVFSLLKRDHLYQDWLFSGGPQAALVSIDRNYLQTNLRHILGTTGIVQNARNVALSPIHILRVISEASEQGTRIGEFGKGLSKGKKTKERLLRSGFESREVSLDFGKAGTTAKWYNQYTAFFNAWLQGADKIKRSMETREGAKRVLARAYVSITLPSLTLWGMTHDKEWYKNAPGWQRDLFWLVPIGGTPDRPDFIWRIPRPFESGLIFGRFPELIAQGLIEQKGLTAGEMISTFSRGATPSILPQAIIPFLEAGVNKSMFRNQPLISARDEKGLPEIQYKPYTTELTKALGRAMADVPIIGDSRFGAPIIMDNFVRQWTGGVGTHLVDALDKSLREAGVLPDPPRPSMRLMDTPFIRGFLMRYPSFDAAPVSQFFERSLKFERGRESAKILQRRFEIEAAIAMQERFKHRMADLSKYREAIAGYGAVINYTGQDPNLSGDEKNQIIDRYLFARIGVANAGLELLETLEEAARAAEENDEVRARRILDRPIQQEEPRLPSRPIQTEGLRVP